MVIFPQLEKPTKLIMKRSVRIMKKNLDKKVEGKNRK